MRKTKIMCSLGLAAALTIGAPDLVRAHSLSIGPDQVRSDPLVRSQESQVNRKRIGRARAARIAREHGIVTVMSIRLAGRNYVVRGRDRFGHLVRVVIEAWGGRVLDARRRT